MMHFFKVKLIDLYITRKFLGTFFFSIALIMMIVVVFDISEKIGDFIDRKAPLKAIAFDYYLNFIPYFANLFSPLFVFISVIYFTSRMAYRSEFIAILSSGVSFNRIVFGPYLASAMVIALLSLWLNHFVIPKANKVRLEFEELYIRDPFNYKDHNIHRQIAPGTIVYFNYYLADKKICQQFSLEKVEDGKRTFHLRSDFAQWDTLKQAWKIHNYFIREINGMEENIRKGFEMDTVINFFPTDLERRITNIEMMDYFQLREFIAEEKQKGALNTEVYEVEALKRTAFPFATFVLTFIGVSIASRRVRGGIGLHIGWGIGLSFSYILLMQVGSQMAIKGGFPSLPAIWLPNIIFLGIAIYLLKKAKK